MTSSTTRTVFRVVAIAEAISWGLLLVAMFCKWILESEPLGLEEGGVPIAGMLHGVVFVVYVVTTLVTSRVFRWNLTTTIVALAASIPPFFTYLFEVGADRRGLLGRPTSVVSA